MGISTTIDATRKAAARSAGGTVLSPCLSLPQCSPWRRWWWRCFEVPGVEPRPHREKHKMRVRVIKQNPRGPFPSLISSNTNSRSPPSRTLPNPPHLVPQHSRRWSPRVAHCLVRLRRQPPGHRSQHTRDCAALTGRNRQSATLVVLTASRGVHHGFWSLDAEAGDGSFLYSTLSAPPPQPPPKSKYCYRLRVLPESPPYLQLRGGGKHPRTRRTLVRWVYEEMAL